MHHRTYFRMCAAGCLKAISAAIQNVPLDVCLISRSNCEVATSCLVYYYKWCT